MIKLLQYKAALIGVLFGLFGGGLSKLLDIDEMASYYPAVTGIIALIVNLLVSFLLTGRWSRALKNNVKIICLLLFTALTITLFVHTQYFLKCTFPYNDYSQKQSYYVKGDQYSTAAIKFKKEHPYIQSDSDLVREGFGSPENKGLVWTPESINKNTLSLITSYSILVIFVVGLTSVLLEVLIGHYKKSTTRNIESIHVTT